MTWRSETGNVGVDHGVWGERVAEEYLRRRGFEIISRNARPVSRDARLEIDLVVWDSGAEEMVFVEVKQHAKPSKYARRLRSITREKKANLRRACNAWRRVNKWRGAYRFDVVEVYGTPEGGAPIVDYIDNVRLFVEDKRFIKW